MALIIAIIDDDKDIRDAISFLLESYEWDVSAFSTCNEFFTGLTNGHKPDCAIIDLHLPDMNGVEVMEELLCRDLEIPIIILSVIEDDPLVVRAKELAAAVLNKPIISNKLVKTINNLFFD